MEAMALQRNVVYTVIERIDEWMDVTSITEAQE